MPTGAFQSHYWPGDGGSPPPPTTRQYIHPYWFDGQTLGSGIVLPRIPRRFRKRLIHYRTKAWRLLPRRIQVSILALRAIWGRDWRDAREAVDWVATHPETRNPKEWRTSQAARIGSDPNIAENYGRFYSAFDRLPSTLPRDRKALLIELAWTGRKHG